MTNIGSYSDMVGIGLGQIKTSWAQARIISYQNWSIRFTESLNELASCYNAPVHTEIICLGLNMQLSSSRVEVDVLLPVKKHEIEDPWLSKSNSCTVSTDFTKNAVFSCINTIS